MGNIIIKFMKNNNKKMNKNISDEEETQLLEELSQQIDKKELSKTHKHIMKEIAYKMFVNNPINEIIIKQSLTNDEQITDIIKKTHEIIKSDANANIESTKHYCIIDDIAYINEQVNQINVNIEKIFKLLETLEVV